MYPCVFWSQLMAMRFAVLITTLNPLTPKISLTILLTVCLPYSSCDVSFENLVLDQLKIP